MDYATIKDIDVAGKTVLVRVDFNVPLKKVPVAGENGQSGREELEITDDLRIRAALPTIEYLRSAGAQKIILISHLGRPGGARVADLSLRIVAEHLAESLPQVDFIDEVYGPEVEKAVKELPKNGVLLLENLRFWPEEEKNDKTFIKKIIDSTGAELFVQDGFAVVHRAHASTSAVADFLPVYAGLLLEKEITNLTSAVKDPVRPLLMLIGGAKVADKAPLISRFLNLADHIAVGGKIAVDYPTNEKLLSAASENAQTAVQIQPENSTAQGIISDNSTSKENLQASENSPEYFRDKLYIAEDFDENADGQKLDIGPLSTAHFSGLITDAKTIIWNGLLGEAEDPAFATSSTIIAEMLGEKTDAKTIICGGDTTGFVEKLMSSHDNLKYSLISTGGGAALEFLSGTTLPGLTVIQKKSEKPA